MTRFRKIPPVAAAIALFLAVGTVRADDATELERAKSSYDAGRYAEGADRFKELLNPAAPNALHAPPAVERARAYFAACLIALGRTDEATEQIERILRNNPIYSPDPVAFPSKVIDRFLDVKSRLKSEIEEAFRVKSDARAKVEKDQRAYIASLQKLAGQETVVVRHSRLLAMIPFGVGQFQNGQDGLGYAFLVTEAILAGTSIAAGVIHMQLIADFARDGTEVDYEDYVSRKNATHDLSIYSTAALALIGLSGVVQAQIAYVPEVREVRTRPIPQPPAITPVAGATPGGFTLGVGGRF